MGRAERCWTVAALGIGLGFAAAQGQGGDAVIGGMYHPAGALASYEVATIKKMDPGAPGAGLTFAGGGHMHSVKSYILNAYGVSSLSQEQVVGGAAWADTEDYVIQGKASDEMRAAMEKMSNDEKRDTNRQMQQSLLAERFKLKVHFETREVPIYVLEPAKGGLKIKDVPAAPPYVPGAPPPPPPVGGGMRPGMMSARFPGPQNGTGMIKGLAMPMTAFVSILRQTPEVGGRQIADKSDFKGSFDANFLWGGLGADVDVPSLFTALEENLGLKLRASKGMVEMLVIDSIERPSEN